MLVELMARLQYRCPVYAVGSFRFWKHGQRCSLIRHLRHSLILPGIRWSGAQFPAFWVEALLVLLP